MRFLKALLLAALLFASASGCRAADAATYSGVAPYSATCRTCTPVIWTVGDSIAHGAIFDGSGGFFYGGGWRKYVYQHLVSIGRTPTMVGGLANASDGLALSVAGTSHNGNNGSSTANWVALYYGTYQPGLAATPTIVTLSTGSNDPDTVGAGQSVGQLMDLAIASYPLANIIVSTVTPISGSSKATINAQIVIEVANRARAGKHVQLVNGAGAVTLGQLSDGQHPSGTGYQMLGDMWVTAIAPLVAR
jgi:lysophospholipase L1-like esterase